MTALGADVVQTAVEAGHIDPVIGRHGLFSMMALKRDYNRARLLGDDFGVPLPTREDLVEDCLRMLGINHSERSRCEKSTELASGAPTFGTATPPK